MEDTNALPSMMDGHEYQAGHHAATLRRMLWREHLGLLPAQPLDASEDPNAQPPDVCPNHWYEGDEWDKLVTDPLCDEVWNMWTERATVNTEVFRHLFHADPDDNIRTFEDYQNFLPRGDMKQGHLYNKYQPEADVKSNLDKIKVSGIHSFRSEQLLTQIRDILCGCRFTSSRTPRWPKRAWQSTTTLRVSTPKYVNTTGRDWDHDIGFWNEGVHGKCGIPFSVKGFILYTRLVLIILHDHELLSTVNYVALALPSRSFSKVM